MLSLLAISTPLTNRNWRPPHFCQNLSFDAFATPEICLFTSILRDRFKECVDTFVYDDTRSRTLSSVLYKTTRNERPFMRIQPSYFQIPCLSNHKPDEPRLEMSLSAFSVNAPESPEHRQLCRFDSPLPHADQSQLSLCLLP